MQKIAQDIWINDDRIIFLGAPVEIRMTVVKLSDGGLWVHSPTKLTDELKDQLAVLGEVCVIVGPNNVHNLHIKSWQQAFPEAKVFVSRGIVDKINLTNYQLLDDADNQLWADDLQRVYIAGVPMFDESVFLHVKSASFIVTDLVQHHQVKPTKSLLGKFRAAIFRLLGFKGQCIAPPVRWGIAIKDKAKFVAAIEQLQRWQYERIIVAHGPVIDVEAMAVFQDLSRKHLLPAS